MSIIQLYGARRGSTEESMRLSAEQVWVAAQPACQCLGREAASPPRALSGSVPASPLMVHAQTSSWSGVRSTAVARTHT